MKKTFASISCLEASSFFIGFGAIQNALRGLDCYPLPRGTFQAANRQQTCCSQKALAGVWLRGSAVPGPWQQWGCCPLTHSELWGDAPMGRRQPAVNHGPRLMVGLAGLPWPDTSAFRFPFALGMFGLVAVSVHINRLEKRCQT